MHLHIEKENVKDKESEYIKRQMDACKSSTDDIQRVHSSDGRKSGDGAGGGILPFPLPSIQRRHLILLGRKTRWAIACRVALKVLKENGVVLQDPKTVMWREFSQFTVELFARDAEIRIYKKHKRTLRLRQRNIGVV